MSRVGFDVFCFEELPPAWQMRPLADLASHVFGGGTPSTRNPDLWGGDIPWTTSAVLDEKCIYLTNYQRRITKKGLHESATQIVPTGSVLIGTRVGVGKTAVTTFDIAISQDLTALVPAPDVCPEYIALVLKSPPVAAWFAENKRGTTIKGVTRADVVRLMVPNPPLPEQRAIAALLRTVQRAKEACEKVIAATRALKQSLLYHLFTYGPVRFDQADRVVLKETEIGIMPEHWHVSRLGDHAIIGNGSTPRRRETRFWEGGTIPWLTSGKVHDSTITYADEFVTPTARKECHLPLVPRGSIVIAITGQGKTLGNSAKLEIDACVSQHLAYISFRSAKIVPDYALAFLRSRYEQLQSISRAGGSTKGALTCGFLKRFEVPLPPQAEQRAISSHLSAVDAKLAAEEKRRTALDNLFQSLLQNLMTGRVRVNHLFDELVGADPCVGPVGARPYGGGNDETGGS